MSSKTRQDKILEILENQGHVTVKYLTEVLHYSSATINRDLNALQSQQLIKRNYGGVEPIRSTYIPVFFRSHKMCAEKRHIGQRAAAFVADGDTIFIDGSTTCQYMEQYLVNRKELTVVTNNIVLAANLGAYAIKVVCLGGTIAEPPCMLYGPESVENAARYRVDKMFFSTEAVSGDGMIASGIYDLMLKAIAKNAKEVFYLVDHQKVDQPFHEVYCDFGAVDHVVSNYMFDQKTRDRYSETDFVVVKT